MGEKNSGKPFFEWLQSRDLGELESYLEKVPKIFLASRSPERVLEMQKKQGNPQKMARGILIRDRGVLQKQRPAKKPLHMAQKTPV